MKISEAYFHHILARCTPEDGCLIWPGGTTGHPKTPYPVGRPPGQKTRTLHRAVFEYVNGYLPEGRKEVIEHTCHRSLCINPDHLRHVTQRQNLLSPGSVTINAINAAKTHCTNGHEFTPENTYVTKPSPSTGKGGGQRSCRACKRDWARQNRTAV